MGNKNIYAAEVYTAHQRRDQQISTHLPRLQQIAATLPPGQTQALLKMDLPSLVHALNRREVTSHQLVAIFALRAASLGKDMCIIT
jgi:hypothetical protein